MERFDAIVIGASVNGLVAAAYLARGGANVLVLERGEQVGGAARSEQRKSGAIFSAEGCAGELIAAAIARDLDLAKYGFCALPVHAAYALAPGLPALRLSSDDGVLARSLYAVSKRDAERIFELRALVCRAAASRVELSGWPLAFDGKRMSVKQGMAQAARIDREQRGELSYFWTASLRDVLDHFLESPLLKVQIATRAMLGSTRRSDEAFTARRLFAHPLLRPYAGPPSLGAYSRRGAGAMTEALAAAASGHGAVLRTAADVRTVMRRRGRVSGVALLDGEEIEARMVVSGVADARSFLALTNASDHNAAATASQSLAKLDLFLDPAPELPALGSLLTREPGDIVVGSPTGELDTPTMILGVPGFVDHTRNGQSGIVMSILMTSVTTMDWNADRRTRFAAQMIKALDAVSPRLSTRIRDLRLTMPGEGEIMTGVAPTDGRLGDGQPGFVSCRPKSPEGANTGLGGAAAAHAALALLSRRGTPWQR